jgi:AraC-like DNA-binding protein
MSGVIGVFQGRFGRITLFEANQPVHEHAHPHVHALFKVSGDDGAYDVAGASCPLTDDRAVLVNPWVPHANWRTTGGPSTTILALYLETGWFGEAAGPGRAFAPFPSPSVVATRSQRQIVASLSAALARPDERPVVEVEADLHELCRDLLAVHSCIRLPAQGLRALDHRVRKAVAIMRQEPHKLDDLASAVGLSRSRFAEQFKTCLGITPGVYSDTLRLEYAIHQLIGSSREVGDIAGDLGFEAQSHFTRFFKQKLGFSPTQYRRVAHSA